MGATLREQNLGSMRWLTASGEATDCFRALGGHMRAEIREAVATVHRHYRRDLVPLDMNPVRWLPNR